MAIDTTETAAAVDEEACLSEVASEEDECLSETELRNLAEARAAFAEAQREAAVQAKGNFRAVVNAGAFARAVALAARGVSGRSTQPVQNNVYLQTHEAGAVRLVATDLEFVQIEVLLPATEAGNGALTLPPRVLEPIARSLPSDVELALSGEATDTPARGRLFSEDAAVGGVEAARTRLNLRGIDARDFELLPPMPDGALTFEVAQGLLKQCLAQVRRAVSTDETRPTLTGVLVIVATWGLEFIATDTHRLALRTTHLETGYVAPRAPAGEPVRFGGYDNQFILSARILGELERLLDPASEAPVGVALAGAQAEFSGLGPNGEVTLSSRVIEGQFPDGHKVVPEKCDRKLTVDRAQFEESLRRLMVIAREDAYRVSFDADGDELTLSAESPDVGDMAERMPCELEGGPVSVCFNGAYFLDGLEGLNCERVSVGLSGPLNPGMIEADEFRYVLMPMQK